MTSTADRLTALNEPEAPKGWTPGLTFDGNVGEMTLTAKNPPEEGDWNAILELHGYDPEKFYVLNDQVGQTTHVRDGAVIQIWYKVKFGRRTEQANVDDIVTSLQDWDVPATPEVTNDDWLTILITDPHIGKGAKAGGGTDAIIKRWKEGVDNAIAGRVFKGIHLAFGGDMIEGYVSQNGRMISGQDLDQQAQIRLATQMVTVTIRKALRHAEEVVVAVAPGNHGETTRTQERVMRDNNDILIVSLVQQAFDNFDPELPITWYYPPEQYGDVTYQVGETTFCLVHGHLFKGQMNGALKWWEGQTMNGRPPAQAQVLLCGHFHNAQIANVTRDRWIMFGPALETESTWFANSTGRTSKSGVLAFEMQDGTPVGIGIY